MNLVKRRIVRAKTIHKCVEEQNTFHHQVFTLIIFS